MAHTTRSRALTLLFLITGQLIIAQRPTILITGGAGYIGSATTLYMLQKNYNVIVIDKKLPSSSFFESSVKVQDATLIHRQSFPKTDRDEASHVLFIQSDFADKATLKELFTSFSIDAVIHFAGFIEVGRSVKDPETFYQNNVKKTMTLLKVMRQHSVEKIIFSSSAAVYGLPKTQSVTEAAVNLPINPYGRTKYMIDLMLEDYVKAYRWKAISLRYFNAAGALPSYDIGERHDPETHAIPLLLQAAYESKPFTIFGDDYATADRTCIRDYLHIHDLAQAHYLALKHLEKDGVTYEAFNLGTGKGSSVKELVECAIKVTGIDIPVLITARRPGDPDWLVADSTKAQTVLGWKPVHSSLENIIATAHEFQVRFQSIS